MRARSSAASAGAGRILGYAPDPPAQRDKRDNAAVALKARVGAAHGFDRAGDGRRASPLADTRALRAARQGLHRAASRACRAALRGTYAGLAHPAALAHLQRLGVTTLSLLPVHYAPTSSALAQGLRNYWGYNTHRLLRAGAALLARPARQHAGDEFRAMVDAAARARHRSDARRGLQPHAPRPTSTARR